MSKPKLMLIGIGLAVAVLAVAGIVFISGFNSGERVDPGAISVTVASKCHQIIFTGEIHDLADPEGNRYVMHATVTGTPNLDVALPDGWTLEYVVIDEPLEVLPFGGGDNCFHNVLRDNLAQRQDHRDPRRLRVGLLRRGGNAQCRVDVYPAP